MHSRAEAVTACGVDSQWQIAFGILGWMKRRSIQPDLWSPVASLRGIWSREGLLPLLPIDVLTAAESSLTDTCNRSFVGPAPRLQCLDQCRRSGRALGVGAAAAGRGQKHSSLLLLGPLVS